MIARRETEHGSGLGRDRWVVERTFAWLHNRRRLLLRTDRRHQTHEAFLDLARCLICWRRIETSHLLGARLSAFAVKRAEDVHAPLCRAEHGRRPAEGLLLSYVESLGVRRDYGTGAPVKESQLIALPSSIAGVPFLRGTLTFAVVLPLGPAVPEQLPPLPSETV